MFVARLMTMSLLLGGAIVGLSFVPELQNSFPQLYDINKATVDTWSLMRPGGPLHPAGFIEHHGHLVIEGCLLAVIIYLFFQSSYKPTNKVLQPLTQKEIQELCDEWQPEPLHKNLTDFQKEVLKAPVVASDAGPHTVVDGKDVINMVSLNFLGLAGNNEIKEACRQTIEKYGVGSCGPRGFYGTIDVHLQLEERLAKFIGTQETILYSYDLATLSSVIPAFANKKDIIVADEACSYAIQNGCHLSRAKVMPFKHNDVDDLERILKKVAAEDRKYNRPLNRRFIIVEGIYANTGELAPLARIKELKTKYKYRLVVDESMSLGVLGENGRGAAEYFGLQPEEDVEIIGASLGNSIASIGGFCAGEREIVDHQRLSGLGYCFSASLPPYLATAGIAALDIFESRGKELMEKLHKNAQRFRQLAGAIPGLRVVADSTDDSISPLVHLQLDPVPVKEQYSTGDLHLQRIVQDCLKQHGVLFTVSKYSMLESNRPPPSIRVALSAGHSPADIDRAVAALKATCKGRSYKP